MNIKEFPYQFASESSLSNLQVERYKLDVQIQYETWKYRCINRSCLNDLISGLKLLSPEEYMKFQDKICETLHGLV